VVHNVTAATRLFDVMNLVAEDPRVEVIFTDPESSAFPDGTAEFLSSRGVRNLPWSSAITAHFDLAVAASHGHTLHQLDAPLIIVPHGMGYNKYLETGNRKPETGNRKPVFGLSDEWLLHQGRVIATVLTLSHDEQLHRLARDSPAAARHARVVGDLVFDQLTASAVRRDRYRRALGVLADETLVLVTSTWGPDSLLGAAARLPESLGTRLPVDEFRIAVAVHPNVWWGHSPWQVRQWLRGCSRAGVTVLEHVDDWRATLVAADVVIGDHGSVSFYAAALGIPVLLAAAPEHAVAPDSPIGRFLRRAPRLTADPGPAEQIRKVMADHDPGDLADLTSLTTSLPGDAPAALRTTIYDLLRLPEPATPADVSLLAAPRRPLPRCDSHLVHVTMAGPHDAHVVRYPAEQLHTEPSSPPLVVGSGETSRRWHELADVIVAEPEDGEPDRLTAALSRSPGAALATAPAKSGGWLVADRHGTVVHATGAGDLFAPVALHAGAEGRALRDLTGDWTITAGGTSTAITVRAISPQADRGGPSARRRGR